MDFRPCFYKNDMTQQEKEFKWLEKVARIQQKSIENPETMSPLDEYCAEMDMEDQKEDALEIKSSQTR